VRPAAFEVQRAALSVNAGNDIRLTRLGLRAAPRATLRMPVVDALGIADRHGAVLPVEGECAPTSVTSVVIRRTSCSAPMSSSSFAAYGRCASYLTIREGFYSHKKFLAAAKSAIQQGTFRLHNVEFAPGAYWAVLERSR
jgi:hypothetical protein